MVGDRINQSCSVGKCPNIGRSGRIVCEASVTIDRDGCLFTAEDGKPAEADWISINRYHRERVIGIGVAVVGQDVKGGTREIRSARAVIDNKRVVIDAGERNIDGPHRLGKSEISDGVGETIRRNIAIVERLDCWCISRVIVDDAGPGDRDSGTHGATGVEIGNRETSAGIIA